MKHRQQISPAVRKHFESGYERLLRNYLRKRSEKELHSAYELGRRALELEIGMMEIATIHHAALGRFLNKNTDEIVCNGAIQLSGRFLVESLSAYEMRQRAHRDAVLTVRKINQMLEQEVKRLANEVHDEAGQLLVAAHLAVADITDDLSPQTQEQIARVNKLLDQVSDRLRQLSHELHSGVLDDLGLVPAVRSLAESVSKRAGIPVRIRASLRRRLPFEIEIAAYRVIQESLANVARHSRAKNAEIGISKRKSNFWCTVKDDGVGFDPARSNSSNTERGLGLAGIQERVNGVGGTLQIHSQIGSGCKIEFKIPLEE